MKKLCFMLTALLLAAPAFAGVNITCAQVGVTNEVELSYAMDGGDANLPRGLGLDITVDNGATIDTIASTSSDFWVYPGTIVITDGNVTDEGTPVAPGTDPCALGDLPGVGMTIEMGSLYDPCDPCHPTGPGSSGVLLSFTVSGDCNVTIAGNATRGNVVLETTVEASVNYGTCSVSGVGGDICPFTVGMVIGGDTITQPMRDIWDTLTDPQKKIWCNECFSRGDTNNDCALDYGNDVTGLKTGYAAFPGVYTPEVDFNKDGAIDYGNDVTRLKTYYPTCPGACTPIP